MIDFGPNIFSKCKKCFGKGYVGETFTTYEYCDCKDGIQLQSDYDKADQKYEAQTMDVEEGTAQ